MSDDLMFQGEIREMVRSAYGAITTGAGRAMAQRFYSEEELASVPVAAVEWALGVGNPVRQAHLAAGEVVLDIGSGGGIDTVLAARQVGPTGRVIGLDMLAEMVERANAVVHEAGVAAWCDLRQGDMEAVPLPDATVDVVISNGVINLSARKSRALAEIARVLRPGGRVCVADLVVDDDLPPEVLSSGAAWAGCIAGALSERVFVRKLERAGLVDIDMGERASLTLDDVALYPLFTPDVLSLMRRLVSDDAQQHIATSLIARARQPASHTRGSPAAGAVASTVVRKLDDLSASADVDGVTVRLLKTGGGRRAHRQGRRAGSRHTPAHPPARPPRPHRCGHRRPATGPATDTAHTRRRVLDRPERAPCHRQRRPRSAAVGVPGLLRRLITPTAGRRFIASAPEGNAAAAPLVLVSATNTQQGAHRVDPRLPLRHLPRRIGEERLDRGRLLPRPRLRLREGVPP